VAVRVAAEETSVEPVEEAVGCEALVVDAWVCPVVVVLATLLVATPVDVAVAPPVVVVVLPADVVVVLETGTPAQTPPVQTSLLVLLFPSSQVVPSALFGLLQAPVVEEQTPTSWH